MYSISHWFIRVVVLTVVGLFASGTAFGTIVDGHAYKEGESNHSGIAVRCLDCALPHDTLFTDASGHFGTWYAISGGQNHDFEYSYLGFVTDTLHYWISGVSVTLPPVTLHRGLCGPLSGTLGPGDWPVVCNISVEAGYTLRILPGAHLLFGGDYDFEITGSLSAIGILDNPIVFTRRYPTEQSRWGGIHFFSSADNCSLAYCRIQYSSTGNCGISCDAWNTTITHCVVSNNSGCGVDYAGSAHVVLVNCTIVNNLGIGVTSPFSETPTWYLTAKNTIIYFNTGGSVQAQHFSATYCDIEGNIDCDPLFADTANGDFHLTWDNFPIQDGTKSCCIDSGDPDSPKDPDGTRADIGAFYFNQPCRSLLVKPDGTGEFPTIQEAIDGARESCDTILLANGTYWGTGNRDINFKGKAITVRSVNGADACTLDCSRNALGIIEAIPHRGFDMHSGEGPTSVIEGITIIRGSSNGGGGILCVGSSPTIRNCRIVGNLASSGGGISCSNSASPTIIRCTITGNKATSNGGGLYCFNNSNPTIISCTISGNKANSGGGIYQQDSYPYLTRTILWGNCAASAAQGNELYCNGGTRHYCCSDVTPGGIAGSCMVGSCLVDSMDIQKDPMFCHPMSCDSAPTLQGNYCLQVSSPCLPDSQPTCGLIGAREVDCSQIPLLGENGVLALYFVLLSIGIFFIARRTLSKNRGLVIK